MHDQNDQHFTCRTLIVATGMFTPNIPTFHGVEHTVGYEDISVNPDDFEGKSVLILGRGNSAFEMADSILGVTNVIHMISRGRVRLSWSTHYVGDLRAVNNGLLDTYQLKSLDGILESPVEDLHIMKHGDKFHIETSHLVDVTDEDGLDRESLNDNFAMREDYDVVIRCLGFKFDDSIFDNYTMPTRADGRKAKFPSIKYNYESTDHPNMYFAGVMSHSLDHRKSAGGFIHGYRYTARALFHGLEWRNHNVKWPSTSGKITDLLNHIIKRVNEASGIYQMFQYLGDVIVLNKDRTEYTYVPEFPVNLIHDFKNHSGHDAESVIVVVLQYGTNFSGPGKDVFRLDRAVGDPDIADSSNFLHPVFYYYKNLPTAAQMKNMMSHEVLPKPDRIHHIVEDFLTDWTGFNSHLLPLRRFLEYSIGSDLRDFFAESCFRLSLTSSSLPQKCQQYLQGQGNMGTPDLIETVKKTNLMTQFTVRSHLL